MQCFLNLTLPVSVRGRNQRFRKNHFSWSIFRFLFWEKIKIQLCLRLRKIIKILAWQTTDIVSAIVLLIDIRLFIFYAQLKVSRDGYKRVQSCIVWIAFVCWKKALTSILSWGYKMYIRVYVSRKQQTQRFLILCLG